MSNEVAIRVEGLSKAYRIGLKEQQHETMLGAMAAWVKSPLKNFRNLRNLSRFDDAAPLSVLGPPSSCHASSPLPLGSSSSAPADVFWALRDVSFEVKHGEAVGIIGRNGAGKSTLLKILSRITEPSRGRATIHGRVGSLLEVGTGFHPDLTGRENVYLNGTILGMRKSEVARKFDQIVDYSGVEKFIDTQVKRYSSGMRVRLAFAVAAHLEPEILIIDEVLAVGDAEFQRKCLNKMEDVTRDGRTVLFVSHNMAAVSALCSRAILLETGSVKLDSVVDESIQAYRTQSSAAENIKTRKDRDGTGALRFTSVEFLDSTACPMSETVTGLPLCVRLAYEVPTGKPLKNVDAAIMVRGQMGELLFVCVASVVRGTFPELPRSGCFICEIPKLPLPPGSYPVDLWAQVGPEVADRVEAAATLDVGSGDYYGLGRLPAQKHRAVLIDYSWRSV